MKALLSLVLILVGCGGEKSLPASPLAPVKVSVLTIEEQNRPLYEEVVGTLTAELRSRIEAKVSGTIKKLSVNVGSKVARGELLIEIDAKEIAAKYDQALAMEKQAATEFQRISKLMAGQAATKQQFEAVQAQLNVARGALNEARAMLDYIKVTAPFDGVVTKRFLDVGDLAAPGKPILELEKGGGVRVELNVPESLISKLALGAEIPVVVGGRKIPSFVTEIAPTADPASRTFLVKTDLAAAEGLRAGQFCRVLLPLGFKLAITLQPTVLIQRGQLDFVMVAVDGRAQLRLIRTARLSDGTIEVLSGLNTGEKIVTTELVKLSDGQALEIVQ